MAHAISAGSRRPLFGFLFPVLLAVGCGSLEYDLSSVPFPISAKPADVPHADVESFEIERKSVLWAHGLFGMTAPDVVALVTEAGEGGDQVAGFRVTQSAGFHDWLITHLTLTLVRMKTVVVEGQVVRSPDP